MSNNGCHVQLADWYQPEQQNILRSLRFEVFVQEQNVPEELEWTGEDGDCVHAIAYDNAGQAIGTGRLDNDGHIGRMAVLKSARGVGAGRSLLQFLIQQAKLRGDKEVHLNAQTHAMDFYKREGFEAYGPEFMEAGISHRAMLKTLGQ